MLRDLTAIIIAAGVVLWGVIAFAGLVYHGKPLSDVGGDALIAIGGALVATLAAYMSGNRG